MKWLGGALLGVLWMVAAWASADAYDYPFDNPWVATVVGTPSDYRAALPEKIPVQRGEIEVFSDREVPEALWYQEKLRYSYALQKGPAPLVFLIAGTGGSHDGAKSEMLARAFYQAGFHVVSLSSPTHPNFIVSASASAVPGHAFRDAGDLYRVMETVRGKLGDRVEVTNFGLTGYSLGGFNAAFVAWLDEQRQVFQFRKVLLINPPVRLYSSVSLLDRMIDNIPGGEDNFNQFFERLIEAFTQVYKRSERIDLSEDALYRAYQALQPKDEQLAALIGTSFRLSSASLAFTSDVMTDFGYVKPKNVHLTKNTSLTEFSRVAHRLGFTDYVHDFFFPYYHAQDPATTRQGLIEQMSLATIEDYLRTAEKIEVMHNEDDLILEPGEIDFFRRVFGERAVIYPKGGHLGNMEYRDNVAHMLSVFTQ
jgi:predicted alpha/beta-fold hydrolase